MPKAGYFYTPFSDTLWGRRFKSKNGWVTKLNASNPGKNRNIINAPGKYRMPGSSNNNLPINPRDAAYFLNKSGAQFALSNQLRPIKSKLAELNAKSQGGRSLFGAAKNDFSRAWNSKVGQQMSGLAGRGFYDSGVRGATAANLAGERQQGVLALRNEVGDLAKARLGRDMRDARRTFGNQTNQMLLQSSLNKRKLRIGS